MGQEDNKVGEELLLLESCFKLQPLEDSAVYLCNGFGPEASQQSCKVCN